MITITITAPAKGSASVRISDPLDIIGSDPAPARTLMVQALLSLEGMVGVVEDCEMPLIKLALLRSFLSTVGATDKCKARRLLLMALMQLDDEDATLRYVKPTEGLPIIAPH